MAHQGDTERLAYSSYMYICIYSVSERIYVAPHVFFSARAHVSKKDIHLHVCSSFGLRVAKIQFPK